MRTTSLLVPLVLAVLGMGCSHNPLVGSWSTAATVGTFTGTETYEINADGTVVWTASGAGSSCTGAWTVTGYTWTATSSSIAFSGTPVCNGALTCGALSLSCSGAGQLKAGSCTYALSNNDDTLALTGCSGTSDVTLTRSP
jgi:hypothetical protein